MGLVSKILGVYYSSYEHPLLMSWVGMSSFKGFKLKDAPPPAPVHAIPQRA